MESKRLENKLVKLCQSGDTEAFEKLIEINGPKMKNWAVSLCKSENRSLVDEVHQLTLIKCWTRISTFKGKSAFLTWANTIARNVFYDLKRASSRHTFISTDIRRRDLSGSSFSNEGANDFFVSETNQLVFGSLRLEDPDSNAVSLGPSHEMMREEKLKEDKELAFRLLEKLSPTHKEVLDLYEYKRLSYKEIAKKTGVSEGTVMSRIFNARKNIKRLISRK